MSVYGYCRISTPQQSITRQIRNIKAEYPKAIILEEAFTGTKMNRPKWNKLYAKVDTGDTIVFDSVSRMSRSADEGVEIYFELYEKGINLVFLKEHYIDTSVYAENMRDKIGRYKDRDRYLSVSLDIIDEMNQIVLEILSLSSVQELGGDKEWIQLDDVVNRILTQNQVLVENRSLSIDNYLPTTSIFMNLPILKLVLSNIISNAVKHSDKGGVVRIGLENGGTDFVIENTIVSKENTSTKAQSKKEGGLGLFVVKYLLEHEELSYRFEESLTGRRFVMVLPKK